MHEKLWTKEYLYSVYILFLCHMGPYLLLSVISLFAKQLTGSDAYAGMMASVFALSGFGDSQMEGESHMLVFHRLDEQAHGIHHDAGVGRFNGDNDVVEMVVDRNA